MKYTPAKPTPSYEEMEAYERGYNMASEEKTILTHLYPDEVLRQAFIRGWEDKLNSVVRDELLPHA